MPYHVRVLIDMDIRVGKWYEVEAKHGHTTIKLLADRLSRADPVVMAYDIETTKLPLKFPDASIDQIMMVSYMIDGQGFLITNREIVSEDIEDFEYTPKPEYPGEFMIFNESDEKALIERFFLHIKEARPTVIATYNGDFFDWPFVDARASVNGIDMYQEIGWRKNSEDHYQCNYSVGMDCFHWVNRDSYLPQGSRGLKAVTVAKLGYDPDELDPELMLRYASERPQQLSEYSVSDAVATYYLYMKYVHPFIFSLCTIIPLGPDAVLRKGTGTLCEMLLMVEAYKKEIVLPNKHQAPKEAFWDGHLLESETYVGGHVESIEAGVFRADIPVNFAVDTTAIDELLEQLDAALKFTIEVEEKKNLADITNFDEVKQMITDRLLSLKATANRSEKPLIYHVDVASMYPNIMTTNRLQPDSMISESDCAACDFNRPGKTCDRRMPWAWRGEYLPAKRDEYNMIRHSLENEKFPGKWGAMKTFQELSPDEQSALVRKRLQTYSQKIYHKIHDSTTIEREAIICQRENPFYIDTVKDFRDRRYHYKGEQKVWKGKTDALKASGGAAADVANGKKMIVLFDSLQLAHKVILNSFYGYVMRKGSRWYSMEMAGVTCLTGAHIIQMARQLVEKIGRPLELDTDGIWCMLPATFPENYGFTMKNGKKFNISYPCVMLNHLVHAKFTNHQYQTLVDKKTFKYATHSDNTIFFEVDGPYKCMVLPTSKEEDKNLKKRYAVFNDDGSLAELKGFELKRRGELKLIKIFQSQIFKFFLEGTTLAETYGAVATVANRWLDVLDKKGETLADEELIDLICENRSMSKALSEYGTQKSTSITTAKRLGEFLGEQMTKDKGLNCKYIICSKPRGAPVTERAVPVAIFSAEPTTKRHFLRKWLKEDPEVMDPRALLDWDYYRERLASVIQKLITIPAALQKVRNPVPRVPHPDWLQRRINVKEDKMKQKKMTDLFQKAPLDDTTHRLNDLEDIPSAIGTQLLRGGKVHDATKEMASRPKASLKRKETEPDVPVNVDPFAALPKIMPDPENDYIGFLQYQKQKWNIQKQARIRRKHLFGEARSAAHSDLGATFRNQAELVYRSTWQVLQLRMTEMPGVVAAYVLIDQKIHKLKFNISRAVFLNMKGKDMPDVEIDGCSAQKVSHTLPNGHPSVHLFKLTMPEDVYVNEGKKLATLFNHTSVEGVYERQVPLDVRAVLKLGTLCTFDESQPGVLGKGLEQGFDLDALKKAEMKKEYLEGSALAYIYLFHIVAGDRQIFALFSTTKDTAHVVILQPARESQELPNLTKSYTENLMKRLQEANGEPWQNAFEYQETIKFTTKYVTTARKAHLEVGDLIKKIKNDESAKPFMLAIQSPQRRRIVQDIPILNDFPILGITYDKMDMAFPTLQWQKFVAKRIAQQYLNLGAWIIHLTALSRYGDVPLCNLQSDDMRFLIDIAYARRLEASNVVLWWSAGARPDHAGHEKDDVLGPLETVQMPSVNNPATYASVCIEIDIRNLAINTILTSSIINELEGADSIGFNPAPSDSDGSAEVLTSDNAFATAGITVLREMVKFWWAAACRGSPMADVMVTHLVRWVESPNSFMYDRSLHYYVQMMSKKAFQQLIADFRRVGSHVVFASSTRLLLQTTKGEVGIASAYSEYIIKSIKQKPLFHFLDMEIREFWDYLVWYDEYNYGGLGTAKVTSEEEQTLDTIMHWQLAKFLPTHMEKQFQKWVVEFITLMHARKRPRLLDDPDNTPRATLMPAHLLGSTQEEKENVLQALEKPLKNEVRKLIRRQKDEMLHPELATDYHFPELPGSHLKYKNPALQFVKSLMQVLSLDKNINLEARLLRKELLQLFDIREFSKEAAFENPSESLKLGTLVCENCTMPRSLDLCRDPDLMPEESSNATASSVPWKCQYCSADFDKLELEQKMIRDVNAMVTQWQGQDLKCGKCKQARINDFLEHCPCSGEWALEISREDLRRRLKVYQRVAKWYGLVMLGEVVDGVISEM